MRTYNSQKINTLLLLFSVPVLLLLIFVSEGFSAAEDVRRDCIRLHVLAESDEDADQSVKLMVRDAILRETEDLFTSGGSFSDVLSRVTEKKEEIELIAENVLKENGFSYGADVFIEEEYFNTRQYDNVTLPAGKYTALKVILGEGRGHNWWCVMFPPLCLPAVTERNEDSVYGVFGESGGDLVTGKSGYRIKFRIVEIVESIIESLKS